MHLIASIGVPYIPGWMELRPFVVELGMILTIVAVLLTPFFVKRSNGASGAVALVGLIVSLLALLYVGPLATASERFAPLLVADPVAFLWKVLLLLFTIGVVVMWFVTSAADMQEGDGPEFFTLLLGAACGMAMMASANNLLMLFLAIELASYPSYVLAGFQKTHRVGAEASLKYVLFGAAASAIMVYGMSLLYGLYGTLNLAELASAMATTANGTVLLVVAVFGLIVGIGFKVAAAPFHFWCPDVFEGASIEVTTFLSVASKGAGLILLLRVVMTIANAFGYVGHNGDLFAAPAVLAVVIGILGALSATLGNTAAFVQNNIKRFLAYSSIAQAGYMLCVIALLTKSANQPDPAPIATQAVLFYLAVYVFMNLGVFMVAGLVEKQTADESLAGFTGLGRRNPVLAFCMTVCLFSLVGLPPVAGFTAKFNILIALIQGGGWWWVLVGIILLNTVFSLYLYARIIRAMYLVPSDRPAFVGNPLGVAVAMMCAIMLVLMFIGWNPVSRLTSNYSRLQLPAPAGGAAAAKMAMR